MVGFSPLTVTASWRGFSEKKAPVRTKLGAKCVIDFLIITFTAIGMAFLLLLWTHCFIYRTFVSMVAKVFRRDLGQMLGRLSAIYAERDVHRNVVNSSIVTVLRIDGNLTVPQLAKLFYDSVLCAKINKKSNALKYLKLQQYPVNFMGYVFWKRDDKFRLENHIWEHEQESMMPISKIHQHMLNSKFAKQRSLWQLAIFRNGHQNRTYLAFRLHHCISDGRSIVNLLVESLGNKTLKSKEVTFKQQTFIDKVKFMVSLPLGIIRYNAHLLKCHLKTVGHPWKRQESSSSQLFVGVSGKVSLDKVNDIASVAGVQTSAVILSVVYSTIKKFILLKNRHISKSLQIYLTLPRQNRLATLTNCFNIGIPDIRHVDDDIQRLQKCNKIYQYLRESDHSRHFVVMSRLMTALPVSMRSRLINSMRVVTIGLSSIDGEDDGFSVGGSPCLGFTMSACALQASVGVYFTVISYKESIQVSVVAKESILQERDTVTLARLVEKEFVRLSQILLG